MMFVHAPIRVITARGNAFLRRLGAWRVASLVLLLLVIPIAAHMALASGISWDEEKQLEYGKRLLAWYTSGFKDRSSFSYMDLYLYGGLFDLPAQLLISTRLPPWGPYETRHVLSALLGLSGIVAVWMTAHRVAGPRAAFLAGVTLALTPTWVGHSLFNCKDIPFAAAAAFVAYSTSRIATRNGPLTWSDALCSGLSVGWALGIRSGGMFLIVFPASAALLRLIFLYWQARVGRGEWVHTARNVAVAACKVLCSVAIAWALMLVAWPWAQVSPIRRPFEAAAIARHFAWAGAMRFDGRVITTDHIPHSYLPIWFKVTLPDSYFLAMVCAVIALALLRKRNIDASRVLAITMLLAFIVLPYLGVVLTHPVIYDAHRHFLFLLPAMAVLAGLGVDAFMANARLPRPLRAAAIVALVALNAVACSDMQALHPYEYIYFNRLSGGLRRQADRFETDYWGLSYREAFDWVVRNVKPQGTKPINVSACNINGPLAYYRARWKARHFVVVDTMDQAEVILAMTRGECGLVAGSLLHTVERLGVPLSVVKRREPTLDRKGSYLESCRHCRTTARALKCECRAANGLWVRSRVSLPCDHAWNNNGRLQCN
jgi:hypothetical protein